jgi:hypothetical protein
LQHERVMTSPKGWKPLIKSYHCAMRQWLVILMIVLMPLRGLAADVMAISMAGPMVGMSHHSAEPVATMQVNGAAALSDCAEHHGMQPLYAAQPVQDSQAASPNADCPTCASCMVCSSAALALAFGWSPVVPLHHATPLPGSTSFSSAAPLPGFKPPIS